MVKVLYLPLNSGGVVQSGVYDAFRQNNCDLEIFDYYQYYEQKKNNRNVRNALIARANQFRPDLIHMQIQHTSVIDAGTVQRLKQDNPKTIISNWTGDVRTYVPKSYKNIAKVSDYNFISSTGQLDMFSREIGKKVRYLQIGYDPKNFYCEPTPRADFAWDISFAGNVARSDKHTDAPLRLQVCRALRREFGDKFGLFGDGWPRDVKSQGSRSQAEICKAVFQKSFCNLSINHYNQIENYWSDRLHMLLASGRPTICYNFPGIENYFTDMCDLVIVNSVQEIIGKVKMLKENPELANFIGKSGAAKVFAEHTYYSRIKELLQIVGLQ